MKKYLVLILIFNLFIFPANAKEKNKLIFNSINLGNENLNIYKTPLSEKNK